jgi:hypothetical protein
MHTWTGASSPAGIAAHQLQVELWQAHRISSDVHQGDKVALVSVATGLVCWTNGIHCWWWCGRFSTQGRRIYTYLPIALVETAARRVAARYDDLRQAEAEAVPDPDAIPLLSPRSLAQISPL